MANLHRGQLVPADATVRQGAADTRVEVTTPCCHVTYRLRLDDVEWAEKHGKPLQVICGKRFHGRGLKRTPDGCGGCLWPFTLTFDRDPDTNAVTGCTWKV